MHPLRNIAVRAARRAGSGIVRSLNQLDSIKVDSKGRNDFVSEVDRAAATQPAFDDENCPAGEIEPCPSVETKYILPLVSYPNTRPSGARKLRGNSAA